jgi:hypothetical protein
MNFPLRHSFLYLLISLVFVACAALGSSPMLEPSPIALEKNSSSFACPVTEPVWLLHPEDSAIQNEPTYGYYYVNEDSSIWASARWPREENPLRAGEGGNKMGWFRPAGAKLEITGKRLDGEAPPPKGMFPCCYPTRFQSSGLHFPTAGCWEVTAKAADSVLTFIVKVEADETR